jgi:hypothetical protein
MKKTSKVSPNKDEKLFTASFLQLFDGKREDIDLKVLIPGQSALIMHKDQVYQIDTVEKLKSDVREMLSDRDLAQLIRLDLWTEIIGEVHASPDFYIELIHAVEDLDSLTLLNLVLNITAVSERPVVAFWHSLRGLDRTGIVFGNALVAGAKQRGIAGLANDLYGLNIDHSSIPSGQQDDGIFEYIFVTDAKSDTVELYLYSQDIEDWLAS